MRKDQVQTKRTKPYMTRNGLESPRSGTKAVKPDVCYGGVMLQRNTRTVRWTVENKQEKYGTNGAQNRGGERDDTNGERDGTRTQEWTIQDQAENKEMGRDRNGR